ncbi:ketopantoate reductase family protein [Cupriavidus pauculus]|uniref:ketopantoate reductase family protein n=1 Tax=Cupriavidus pauculus TaxID=82633 RepID=UPI001EE37028|nr:ketopantoate reductase family protein [Cupriavidus pauculus]GJG97632.1 ketopantoate reductase family protein [Cupriavidus pauculus]
MKITVIGAGAVGCFYGAMVAKAGFETVLVGRPAHVDAIQRSGLRFESAAFDQHIAIGASTSAQAAKDADIVLLCVKSTDTLSAANEMRPFLKPGAVVISLQNGIDNVPLLQEALPCEVIPAAVYVACEMAGAGHLKHHGRGELIIGMSRGSAGIARLFCEAGVPTTVSADVMVPLWDKLVLNCAYNALSAIVRLPYGDIRAEAAADDTMRNLVAECLAVAHAEGVGMDLDTDRQIERIRQTIPAGQCSSMAQDLSRKRPTEIASLNGTIVRRGLSHGIATPINQAMVALVTLLEKHAGQGG